MTLRRGFVRSLQAALVGLLFAVAFSGDAVISGQSWVAGATITAVAMLSRDFLNSVDLEPMTFQPVWMRTPRRDEAYAARGLRALGVLVSNAQSNPRAYMTQLRSPLVELAEHFLPIGYGIDLSEKRAVKVLGDVYWLIDPNVIDRAPSAAEIDEFIDVLHPAELGEPATTPDGVKT